MLDYPTGLHLWDCSNLGSVAELLNLAGAQWGAVEFAGVLPDPPSRPRSAVAAASAGFSGWGVEGVTPGVTPAGSLSFTLLELARNPDVQARLREEIRESVYPPGSKERFMGA
ncbi:hypothetical protein GY45DRAFT_1376125 [Cubamyces sp. BRFM 1775]|nr:hypothetical protein GY45DRAFT_1376125 [Cubamyces sp. BRFM 1775]